MSLPELIGCYWGYTPPPGRSEAEKLHVLSRWFNQAPSAGLRTRETGRRTKEGAAVFASVLPLPGARDALLMPEPCLGPSHEAPVG